MRRLLWVGATYRLDTEECAEVCREAERRDAWSKAHSQRYQNFTPFTPLELGCNSVGAEIALAGLTGGWWQPTPLGCSHTDSTDVYWRTGLTLDAKQTHHRNGRLQRSTNADGRGDRYVLLIGELPTYEFKGWLTHEELRTLGHCIPQATGWCWAMGQRGLHQWMELP